MGKNKYAYYGWQSKAYLITHTEEWENMKELGLDVVEYPSTETIRQTVERVIRKIIREGSK